MDWKWDHDKKFPQDGKGALQKAEVRPKEGKKTVTSV
jgi:hypothetical protein